MTYNELNWFGLDALLRAYSPRLGEPDLPEGLELVLVALDAKQGTASVLTNELFPLSSAVGKAVSDLLHCVNAQTSVLRGAVCARRPPRI